MKPTTCLPASSLLTLILTGCGADGGMVAPATRFLTREAPVTSSTWSTPVPLTTINSSVAVDQQPALSKDGLSLYFASNRTDNPAVTGDQNIWVAQRPCSDNTAVQCAWGSPAKLGEGVNGPSLDASPALSRDEHWLFFASQRRGDAPRWIGDSCTRAPCDRDLWVSYREDVHSDAGWQPAMNLGPPVNTNGEEVAPSYFQNEDSGLPQLFFNDGVVNAMTGILGLGDIYVSELTPDGTWIGRSQIDETNTPCSDQRPSVSHDGRQLYFHSTRSLIGAGCVAAAQIFVATRQDVSDPWSSPVLVPTPIADLPAIHPFIHSHGNIETLLLVRGGDIWMSQRTRNNRSD
jgi:hypothetical protein